jgi:hypothetical protein
MLQISHTGILPNLTPTQPQEKFTWIESTLFARELKNKGSYTVFLELLSTEDCGACNSSYSGGRDQEDGSLKPTRAKSA